MEIWKNFYVGILYNTTILLGANQNLNYWFLKKKNQKFLFLPQIYGCFHHKSWIFQKLESPKLGATDLNQTHTLILLLTLNTLETPLTTRLFQSLPGLRRRNRLQILKSIGPRLQILFQSLLARDGAWILSIKIRSENNNSGNDHEVEFHEIKIRFFHEIEIMIMRSKLDLIMRSKLSKYILQFQSGGRMFLCTDG